MRTDPALDSSASKTLALLEAIIDEREAALGRVAAAAGVSKPTAHRLLQVLHARGYVCRTKGRRYTAGPMVQRLAELATQAAPCASHDDALRTLQRLSGETVHLALLSDGAAVYAEKVAGHPQSLSSAVGASAALHCTAVGKVMLAWHSREHRRRLVADAGAPARTARTATSWMRLEPDLERIRRRGWAIDDEENEPGVRCIGAPVFDTHGALVGGVSVAGPAERIGRPEMRRLVPAVVATARAVSVGGDVAARPSEDSHGPTRRRIA